MQVQEKVQRGFTRKRCPKCSGNIYIDRDFGSWYESCLQCGRRYYLPDLLENMRDRAEDVVQEALVRNRRSN